METCRTIDEEYLAEFTEAGPEVNRARVGMDGETLAALPDEDLAILARAMPLEVCDLMGRDIANEDLLQVFSRLPDDVQVEVTPFLVAASNLATGDTPNLTIH